MAGDWRLDRIGTALRGENPTVLKTMEAGFAVVGDVQFLPGYCVLLAGDPSVTRLTDLPRPRRLVFLSDMERLGEAVERVCSRRDPDFRRVNLEILGNTDPFLHAHVWPRYDWEPPALLSRGLPMRFLPRDCHGIVRLRWGGEAAQLRHRRRAPLPPSDLPSMGAE